VEQQTVAARMRLFGMSFRDIEMAVRRQFTKMFADYGFDAERDIAAIVANRWGHAYVVSPPGFYYGRNGKPAPRDVVREGYGRVRFAHSELTGQQMWEHGVSEGERAVKQVLGMA
jgi:spermidine dehydrogenase